MEAAPNYVGAETPPVEPTSVGSPGAAGGDQRLDDDAEIERMARLSPLELGRAIKVAVKQFGVSAKFIEDAVKDKRRELRIVKDDGKQGHALDLLAPEPWPNSVDGAELLDEMTAAIRRYVVMAEHAARAAALWCVHTYLLDQFLISPRLAIRSAAHRCGKTTLLDTIFYLALRALSSANVTAASVFRVIEACRATLLIDEADTFLAGNEELRGVMNSGHRKGGTVIRTVGDDCEPRAFSTYAACAIALIGNARARPRSWRNAKTPKFRPHMMLTASTVHRLADRARRARQSVVSGGSRVPTDLFYRSRSMARHASGQVR
jgi:hypothetical protein